METKRKILNNYRSGEAIRSISRKLNISRNSVRTIIRGTTPLVSSYKRSKQHYPALEGYLDYLETLLRDNKKAKPKRNMVHLFEELQSQGYKGSYSSVSRYASKWQKRNLIVSPSACVPLEFLPGEAFQFDWSTDYVKINDEVVTVKVGHFVMCYSGKKFVCIYPNETQEMIFDAHVRAFEFFGGVPSRGIYDNMKTAVTKVFKGKDRKWNPSFEHLCAHYRFEPTACSPARGNEKGRVERNVQIDREQFFTPMPQGNSLQELNDRLLSQLIIYNKTHKHPKYKAKTLDEVFEEERHCLLSAPLLFDGYKEINIKVSTTCLARYESNYYSVPCSCAGQIVQCKPYADKLLFTYEGKEVARHERKFTKGKTYYNYLHYLPILARKPGALRNGAPFVDMVLPDELNTVRLHLEQHSNGARDFAHILSYIPIESMESVISSCSIAIKAKTISKDVILNILLRQNDEAEVEESNVVHLQLKHIPEAKCELYNKLLSQGGHHE